MSTESTRTVLIGVDALSFDYLDRFDLPYIQSLRSQGVEAPLDSTFPPWTGSAWPSVYTGVGPDHHGVYSFFDFRDTYPDDAEIVSRRTVRSPAIWDYLSDREIPSAVLNVPVTHRGGPIDGSLIPGYLAAEDAEGSPPGIRDEIEAELGEPYRIYADSEDDHEQDSSPEEFAALIDHRRRAARAMLKTTDWQFAFLQLQKTDTVFHEFDDEAAFRRVYEAADEFVGTVLETVPDGTNAIICSDHGIGRTTGYNIYVNEVLRRHGFVETCSDGETPTLAGRKGSLSDRSGPGGESETGIGTESNDQQRGSNSMGQRAVSVAESALRAVGLSPGDAYRFVRRVGAEPIVKRLLPEGTHDALGENVDWRRSQAYCRSGPELGVRINLEGRDPEGVVPPSAYEDVRSELIDVLETLRTPDGEPAFEWVRPREAVYDGPCAEEACDVLFMPREMNNLVATNLLGTEFVPIDKHNHKRTGVFIGAGPGFDAAAAQTQTPQTRTWTQRDPLSVIDVAPMAMALLDEPIPERMRGSVPSDLLSIRPRFAEYETIGFGEDVDSEEKESPENDEVVDRLENLGYL